MQFFRCISRAERKLNIATLNAKGKGPAPSCSFLLPNAFFRCCEKNKPQIEEVHTLEIYSFQDHSKCIFGYLHKSYLLKFTKFYLILRGVAIIFGRFLRSSPRFLFFGETAEKAGETVNRNRSLVLLSSQRETFPDLGRAESMRPGRNRAINVVTVGKKKGEETLRQRPQKSG